MNRLKFIFANCLVVLCIAFFFSLNSPCCARNYMINEPIDTFEVNFPIGTMFRGLLIQKLSSSFNNVGDTVTLIIPADIKSSDNTCIPKDSLFIGKIIRVEKAKEGQNGFVQIIFTTLRIADMPDIPIYAHLWTKVGDGIVGGEMTERVGYRKIVHNIDGIGSLCQFVPYGPRKMGKDTDVLPGTEWVIVLDKNLKYNMILE